MAYEPLPIIEASLDHLHLDLDNYRLASRPDDEVSALRRLYESEDVLEAARLILREGYFDNEVPIVTHHDAAGFVVLEGNRRVSALKGLQDPAIVPSHTTDLQALLNRYATEARDLPLKVRVLIAPDRETARPHIARLHTGLSKRRWSRDQQATFYYSLLDETTTVDDVRAEYPGVEVIRFIKMAVVRRFLLGVKFRDSSLHDYVAGESLRMSSFEYAYRRSAIAEAVGLQFDRDGLLLPRSSTPESVGEKLGRSKRSALELLVNEFRAERLNTRSPEFKESSEQYPILLKRLTGSKAPAPAATGQQGAGTEPTETAAASTQEGGSRGSGSDTATASSSRGPNHPDTRKRLDLTSVDYSRTPVNLRRRYHELRGLGIAEFPVTAAILLRSVLEMTIKWHFQNSSSPAEGMLKDAFKVVEKAYGQEKALRNTCSAIASGNAQRPGSLQWFNCAAHDVAAVVKADDVRQAWEQVIPVLNRLLQAQPI